MYKTFNDASKYFGSWLQKLCILLIKCDAFKSNAFIAWPIRKCIISYESQPETDCWLHVEFSSVCNSQFVNYSRKSKKCYQMWPNFWRTAKQPILDPVHHIFINNFRTSRVWHAIKRNTWKAESSRKLASDSEWIISIVYSFDFLRFTFECKVLMLQIWILV